MQGFENMAEFFRLMDDQETVLLKPSGLEFHRDGFGNVRFYVFPDYLFVTVYAVTDPDRTVGHITFYEDESAAMKVNKILRFVFCNTGLISDVEGLSPKIKKVAGKTVVRRIKK